MYNVLSINVYPVLNTFSRFLSFSMVSMCVATADHELKKRRAIVSILRRWFSFELVTFDGT